MKQLLFLLPILSFALTIQAQGLEYNFDEYLYPDLKRETFEIIPKFNFRSSSRQDSDFNFQSDLDLTGTYTYINSNRDEQTEMFIIAGLGGSYSSNTEQTSANKYAADFRFRRHQKYYITDEQFTNLEFDFDSFLNKKYRDDLGLIGFQVNFSPRIGYGRLENISDVWQAISTLNLLKEEGVLLKELSEEDITKFSLEIAQIRNTRQLDFRLENRFEQESILEYAVTNGLIDINDYRSITTLLDAYRYEDFTYRKNGRTIEFGIDLNYNINQSTLYADGQRFSGQALVVQFESNKATSNTWQIDHLITAKGGFWNNSPYGTDLYDNRHFLRLDYELGIGYYLSARSYLQSSWNTQYSTFINEPNNTLNSYLRISYNYYFSPAYRLQLFSNININRSEFRGPQIIEGHNSNLGVTLNYFVF